MSFADLRNRFNHLHSECNKLVEECAHASEGIGRRFTAEEKTAQDKRMTEMETIKSLIDEQNRVAQFSVMKAVEAGAEQAKEEFKKAEISFGNPQKFTKKEAVECYMLKGVVPPGFDNLMRNGELNDKFSGLGSTSQSSVMLPVEVMEPYAILRNANGFRKAKRLMNSPVIYTTATDQINVPVFDDTGNFGSVLNETTAVETDADSVLTGSITLSPTPWQSGTKWFSNTLINANGYDIFAEVFPILQLMIDKGQESAWTTTAKTLTGSTMYTLAADATGVTFADILSWEHSIPYIFRQDACFILSDVLYREIRGLVDKNGQPIIDKNPAQTLAAGPGLPAVEVLHGHPLIVGDFFDTDPITAGATGKYGGVFASAQCIKIRDAGEPRIARYSLIPSRPDQSGFNYFSNAAIGFVANGVSLLQY